MDVVNGWATREKKSTRVWHYFEDGFSICDRVWSDPKPPVLTTLPKGVFACPDCAKARLPQEGKPR